MENKVQILFQKLESEFEGLSDEEILQKSRENFQWRMKVALMYAEYENTKYIQGLYDKLAESMKAAKNDVEQKCVYILELDNKTVKIGCTKDFKRRMNAISTGSGLSVVNWCYSQNFDYKDAYGIEKMCHEAFASKRIKGEFFNIGFDYAVVELAKYTDKLVTSYEEVL